MVTIKAVSQGIETLNRYLAAARTAVAGSRPIHVVIGNEAADLDSMASSILYGFFTASHRAAPDDAGCVPVVNIPRRDFVLRTEAAFLFGDVGMDVGSVPFIDEIDLGALRRDNRLTLTLIDHNILAADQEQLADAVTAVIDHHEDRGLFPDAAPRIIEPVGSAATLVADIILADAPELLDAGIATLLLGTILVDTVNLSRDAKRVTAKDETIAARLAGITGGDPNALFERLQAEKFNVSALGTADLLRKDYKEWTAGPVRYGISTVLTSMSAWIAKDAQIIGGCRAFMRERGLQCLIAMMAYSDAEGRFRRELAVFATEPALTERLTVRLAAPPVAGRRTHPLASTVADAAAFLVHVDPSCSRKILQPVLDAFLAGEAG